MNPHLWLAQASSQLWPAVANHLWQATLCLLLVLVLNEALKRGPARGRYAMLLVAAVKFAIPSALFFAIAARIGVDFRSIFAAGSGGGAGAGVFQFAEPIAQFVIPTGGSEAVPSHLEIYCALTLAWAAGFATVIAIWVLRRRKLSLTIAAGKFTGAGREAAMLEQVQTRLGVRRPMKLCFVAKPI